MIGPPNLLRAHEVRVPIVCPSNFFTMGVGGGEIGGQFRGAREPVAEDVSTGSSSLLRLWTYPE